MVRDDVDGHVLPFAKILRSTVFERPIAAAVDVGVLREVVEAVARAIEAGSDEMAAVVSSAAINTTRLALVRL